MNYPVFVTICLFINRGDSRSGKNTLHKEKKRKETIEATARTKNIRNISSTETLQYCSHSSSSNMVAVNFRPD